MIMCNHMYKMIIQRVIFQASRNNFNSRKCSNQIARSIIDLVPSVKLDENEVI